LKRYPLLLVLTLAVFTTLCGYITVQDELTKVHNVSPGEASSGSILLYNPNERAVTVKVSQADYTYNAQNETNFIEPGKFNRSNADWIKFPASLNIPANETATLYYNYQVPRSADLIGTYWSVLFIEEETPYLAEASEDLYIRHRYYVQIVHNINGTGSIDLSFLETDVQRDSVTLILKNTGNRRLYFSVKVDIYDERAIFVGSFISQKSGIYPNLERQITVPITPLLPSNYHAVIVVDCGDNQVFGHQVSFSIR